MIDRSVCFAQKLLSLLDSLSVDIFGDSTASVFVKALVENVFGNVKCGTKIRNAQITVQVVFDIRGCKGYKITVIYLNGIFKENVREKIAKAIYAIV